MSFEESKSSLARLGGEALFVSGHLASDAACAERKPSQAGSSVKEVVFSFFDCSPVPQGPQITVLSDVSDLSDRFGYTVIAEAVRDFCGWITVTAYAVVRSAVRAFRRIVCEAKARFRRRITLCMGGLRL